MKNTYVIVTQEIREVTYRCKADSAIEAVIKVTQDDATEYKTDRTKFLPVSDWEIFENGEFIAGHELIETDEDNEIERLDI